MSYKAYFDAEFLRRLEGLHLLAKRLAERAPAGGRCSRALGDGLEFADHRAYTPGDDVRFLDWPYYARMEKLLLRLFHRHSESDVAILLDTSASMGVDEAKFDYARRVAAALAYIAVGGGRRVIAQPFADTLAPPVRSARDRAKILPFFEALDELSPAGTTALESSLRAFAQGAKNVGTVILLSDLLDTAGEFSAALAYLAPRLRDVIVLHVYSPSDANPAPAGAVQLQHAETAQSLRLDLTPALCEGYSEAWEEYRRDIEHTCRTRNAMYLAAPAGRPFETLILQTLRRAGVLRG